ncbi:MAG: hypothetical protein MJE68_24930 [Proteobacteria bacterium]|nr:hypothetical protein [Pseudomonadota bacterium]
MSPTTISVESLPHAKKNYVPPYNPTVKITSHLPIKDLARNEKIKKRKFIRSPTGQLLSIQAVKDALLQSTTHQPSQPEKALRSIEELKNQDPKLRK